MGGANAPKEVTLTNRRRGAVAAGPARAHAPAMARSRVAGVTVRSAGPQLTAAPAQSRANKPRAKTAASKRNEEIDKLLWGAPANEDNDEQPEEEPEEEEPAPIASAPKVKKRATKAKK